jgi:hypothetical protein
MRIFLASILNFVLFQCYLCINNKILVKKIFYWTIMGELRLFRVVLGLRGMENIFKRGQKIFYFLNHI